MQYWIANNFCCVQSICIHDIGIQDIPSETIHIPSQLHLPLRHLSKTWALETFTSKSLAPKTFASKRFVAKTFQSIHTRTFVSDHEVMRSCNSPHTCICWVWVLCSFHSCCFSEQRNLWVLLNETLEEESTWTLLCHFMVSNHIVRTIMISTLTAQIFDFCCSYTNTYVIEWWTFTHLFT